jgi:hypothetical protein
MADHIRYDLLTQQALRGVVRSVLTDAARKGLPGEHHFYISFDTQADGVRLSDRLRTQYPEEMTVILQHQFWDLAVNEHGFEVGMSFGGIPEKLYIPFEAINGFFDPSVQFGLQFEHIAEDQDIPTQDAKKQTGKKGRLAPVAAPEKSAKKPRQSAAAPAATSVPTVSPAADTAEPAEPKPDKPSGGGEVVRLDRFRKK